MGDWGAIVVNKTFLNFSETFFIKALSEISRVKSGPKTKAAPRGGFLLLVEPGRIELPTS
jgi:hypothetical protein